MSALRQVLVEVRRARGGGVSLDDVAARVGVGRDEAAAMIDYWVRRGTLNAETLGPGCPGGGCGSCPSGHGNAPGCGRSGPAAGPGGPIEPAGPVLVAISIGRRPG